MTRHLHIVPPLPLSPVEAVLVDMECAAVLINAALDRMLAGDVG